MARPGRSPPSSWCITSMSIISGDFYIPINEVPSGYD
jgi:hypothetical protein